MSGQITLVLGGARSGKSRIAENLAAKSPQPVTYLATGSASDPAMNERIARHRDRRPAHWSTVEAGPRLIEHLGIATGTVLIDALGTWVAAQRDFQVDVEALVAVLTSRTGDTILVSDEVGMGVHPSTEIGNRFRDALGTVNQAVATIADRAWLVVAGRVLSLDPPP